MRLAYLAAIVFAGLEVTVGAENGFPTRPAQVIPLPGVEGRIDHLAVDLRGQRLFVAALGNNTLEVVDLKQAARLRSITGLREPQGVAFIPEHDWIVVANGADGSVRVFDGTTYRQVRTIDCRSDADNLRYDAAGKRIYVGYGDGALTAIDLETGVRVVDIPLGGHPESFQLESRGKRVFVNVPSAGRIAVIDRQAGAVTATWSVKQAEANYPMALDDANHRLLVACRKPPQLLVLDVDTGKVVASAPCSGDADDVFYDARRKQVYLSGGAGSISVFEQLDADHYRPLATIPTATGARTSLFVPATNSLYLAVPYRGSQQAALWVYRLSAE